jgi:hypothetical protein
MFLTPDEVRKLTGKTRREAQARALEAMGVPFTQRPDGSPVVLRAVVESMLGGTATIARSEPQLQP